MSQQPEPYPKSAMSPEPQKEHIHLTPQKDVAGVHTPAFLLQHTLGHLNCPACEKLRAELICSISADLEFSTAAHRWMEARSVSALPGAITARYISKNTERCYRQFIDTLELFFTGMKLGEIHMGHVSAYQIARLQGNPPFIRKRRPQDKEAKSSPVKPQKVNQEIRLLSHLMKRANCWTTEMEEIYQPILDIEEEIPRSLTPSEQQNWLEVSSIKPRWHVVHHYSTVCFGTCLATNEIRGLRLGDINLYQKVITVARKTAKNRHRARTIEIVGADTLWALEQLLARAKEYGAREHHHYLFPWRESIGHYNPEKGMGESGIKVPWNEVRKASGLTWFRQYDCRHTAITRLAEAGVPSDIIMSRAGHVSEKMRRHYTHISQSAQRQWMEMAQGFRPQSTYAPYAGFRPQTVAAKRLG